jgi:hypothetical protein
MSALSNSGEGAKFSSGTRQLEIARALTGQVVNGQGGSSIERWPCEELLGPRRLWLPSLLAVTDADEFGFFLFLSLFEERGEALGAKAEFLLYTGVRIIGIVEFLEQEEKIKLGVGQLDLGVVGDGELGVRASGTQSSNRVDLVFLGQGLVEVEDPGIELIIDADNLLAGFEHGKR